MWSDKISERFWWHHGQSALDQLLDELAKAEDEEEVELYLLNLHHGNHHDFQCFTPKEIKVIKEILRLLIDESHRHKALLSQLIDSVKEMRGRYVS